MWSKLYVEVIGSNSNWQLNMCFQRKQKDVSKENEFYMQLLQQALPLEQQQTQQPLPQQQQQQSCQNTSPEKSRGKAPICLLQQTPFLIQGLVKKSWVF